MPELPEVHTILEELRDAVLIGQSIEDVIISWPRTIDKMDAVDFRNILLHKQIIDLKRRGKFILIMLSDGWCLCIHLRMTGKLLLLPHLSPATSHVRLQLQLSDQRQLHFHDTRKFGRWYLVRDCNEVVGQLGPEPLGEDFSLTRFCEQLKARKTALKPLLLDQHFLAGLGNIYVDEALFEAGLHPLQRAFTLKSDQVQRLHKSIISVLKQGVSYRGTSLGKGKANYYRPDGSSGIHQNILKVFRRTGQSCPNCGQTIQRIVVAQRSTHFCPKCQPLLE